MTAQPAIKVCRAYGKERRAPFVCIELSVTEMLETYIQDGASDDEAGGILIGRRTVSGHIVVSEASTPQSTDERSRFGILRNRVGHQEMARERWQSSKGELDYVGEWHTHPEDIPCPSIIDRADWMKAWVFHGRKPLVHLIQGRRSLSVFRQSTFVPESLERVCAL